MVWWQYLLLIGTNFFSILLVFGLINHSNERKKDKIARAFVENLEQKIGTDIDFMNIMEKNFGIERDGDDER